MTITEVGCMGVKPNLDVMDPTTPEGEILTKAWKTVTVKPGGPSQVLWGLEVKNPSWLWAFFDFESVEQHQHFAEEYGAEAVKDIPTICTHGEFSKHVQILPSSDVLQSPLTEVFLVYFPPDIAESERKDIAARLQQLLETCFRVGLDVSALATGWGLEKDFRVRGGDGEIGSVIMGFVGWTSLESQERFHSLDQYKDALTAIREIHDSIGFDTFSLDCQGMKREEE